ITRLVQAGAITTDTAAEWAKNDRYPPEVIAPLRQYWDSLGGVTTDPHLTKAQVQLWTATHRAYLTGELTDADATTALTQAGVPSASVVPILQLWQEEANITRKRLTAAQVKRAYHKSDINPVTGLAWTRDEAITRLVELGYPVSEANAYLNI